MAAPFDSFKGFNYSSMSSRFSSVLGMEELRKLRHREAQRRYMARKKIAAKKLQLARQLYERQGQS